MIVLLSERGRSLSVKELSIVKFTLSSREDSQTAAISEGLPRVEKHEEHFHAQKLRLSMLDDELRQLLRQSNEQQRND